MTMMNAQNATGHSSVDAARAVLAYLDRLAGAWEYASPADLRVVDRLAADLERRVRGTRLPPSASVGALLSAMRAALGRADRHDGEARMRHLEGAARAVEMLIEAIEADRPLSGGRSAAAGRAAGRRGRPAAAGA